MRRIVAHHATSEGGVLQAAEQRLSRFIEEVVVSPNMIDTIVDGEVSTFFVSFYCHLS